MGRTFFTKEMVAGSVVTLLGTQGVVWAQFTDVTIERGIGAFTVADGMSAGVAAADYDNDGDIDLLVPTEIGKPPHLYRNDGNGFFVDVAGDVGITTIERMRGALWFDYNGDHRLDLVMGGDYYDMLFPQLRVTTLRLYRQESDGMFTDVTAEASVFTNYIPHASSNNRGHVSGFSAGDVDQDGDLDLLVTIWRGPILFLMNNGDGTFTNIEDAIETTGPDVGIGADNTPWQAVMHDFNRDGLIDIYQAIDFAPNRLWINSGNWTFEDVAPAVGVDNLMNDMGVSISDFDADGDFDIYVTNIKKKDPDVWHNVLFRNDSAGGAMAFAEVSVEAGVDEGYWGWGCSFFDCNNDGMTDIAAANGWPEAPFDETPAKLFLNLGAVGMPDTFGEWPFDDISASFSFDNTHIGTGLVSFDADGDNDLELFQVSQKGDPLVLLHNTCREIDGGNAITVRPRMPGLNHRAIGAVVRVTAGGITQSRLITAGCSLLCQEPAEAHFGLADVELIDEIRIEWPGGPIAPADTVLMNVSANQIVRMVAGCAGDLTGDNQVTTADLTEFIGTFGQTVPADTAGDLDGDGVVTTTDLTEFLALFGTGC